MKTKFIPFAFQTLIFENFGTSRPHVLLCTLRALGPYFQIQISKSIGYSCLAIVSITLGLIAPAESASSGLVALSPDAHALDSTGMNLKFQIRCDPAEANRLDEIRQDDVVRWCFVNREKYKERLSILYRIYPTVPIAEKDQGMFEGFLCSLTYEAAIQTIPDANFIHEMAYNRHLRADYLEAACMTLTRHGICAGLQMLQDFQRDIDCKVPDYALYDEIFENDEATGRIDEDYDDETLQFYWRELENAVA
ncbi:MAG: hypothetical protein NTX76_05740 [Alphaproteobacteria bacterium]|nr:hypothetical protein [Alphaproteobacteria bacterium]